MAVDGLRQVGAIVEDSERELDRRLHIAVIGSGGGAFAAALYAADAGVRVTMIEAADLGGTCVNVGCVPSKILVQAAHVAHEHGAHPFAGISRTPAVVDRRALSAQQQARVKDLQNEKYQKVLADRPGIELVRGTASFVDAQTLRIERAAGGTVVLRPDRILIATGASPSIPPIPGLTASPFWTSTSALASAELPSHLLVLGGSLVAVELGQAFLRLGSKVTLLARSSLLSHADPALGEGLRAALAGEGMDVLLHTVPRAVRHDNERFTLETAQGTHHGSHLLVATGRTPNSSRLSLERAGVATDQDGAIVVDDYLRTNVPHVYAVGDCTTLPRFVYVAAAAGTRAAVNMTGGDARLDLATMPAVVFTDPQVAWVGLTEAAASARGIVVESRTLSLADVPRALVNFDTRGFVKLVAEAGSGRLLGAQVLAAQAGEVIQTAALALRAQLTVRELGEQLFPYLTMVEGLKLAAQSFSKDVHRLSCCAG